MMKRLLMNNLNDETFPIFYKTLHTQNVPYNKQKETKWPLPNT